MFKQEITLKHDAIFRKHNILMFSSTSTFFRRTQTHLYDAGNLHRYMQIVLI